MSDKAPDLIQEKRNRKKSKTSMVHIADSIRYYDQLLEKYEPSLVDIFASFTKECETKKLTFGGRAMYNFLRPNFISIEQYGYIKHVCSVLRNAITKFKESALANPHIMSQAGIVAKEKELVDIHPGYDRLSITARWDSFLDKNSLKFVELNAECPAGIAYSDVAAGVYANLPFIKDFKKKYTVAEFQIRQTLLDGLLETYAIYRGNKRSNKPTIAIVDWREVPTYTEFQLFQEFFESEGFECIIADPRDLTYDENVLRCGDVAIDLVYKRILTNDCVNRVEETKALVDAYRDHNVCIINSFRAKIIHKKSIFAVLTHEMNNEMFTAEELGVISKHIPWTRTIRDETTLFRGTKINLLEYVSENKDDFVIKPNDEYGGKGVSLGKESTQEHWNKIIEEARDGEYFVVQEMVPIPRVPFPIIDGARMRYADMVVDMDPYVFGAKVEGVLTRLSSSSLANVTAGGGTTPTFVLSEK